MDIINIIKNIKKSLITVNESMNNNRSKCKKKSNVKFDLHQNYFDVKNFIDI